MGREGCLRDGKRSIPILLDMESICYCYGHRNLYNYDMSKEKIQGSTKKMKKYRAKKALSNKVGEVIFGKIIYRT